MIILFLAPFTSNMRYGVDGSAGGAELRSFRVLSSPHDPMVHCGAKIYVHVSNSRMKERDFL